jgi:4-oxalocrotonate tautomerase
MPAVHIYIAEGRTKEQKRALAKKVTAALMETIKPTSPVELFVHELPRDDIAVDGVMLSDR